MKPLIFLSVFLFACTASKKIAEGSATPTPPPAPAAFVTWDHKMVELGIVKKGEKKQTAFSFINTSGESIQIDIVDACDCTKVEFTRGVIEPGGSGKLDVIFNSADKDESETIDINVVFKNLDPASGFPRIERVQYKFDLVK